MRAAPRGVSHLRLQIRANIQQRVIPPANLARFGAAGRHQRLKLLVRNRFAIGEQRVDEHGANVRLDIDSGKVACERGDAGGRCRTDTRQLPQLLHRFGQAPAEALRAFLGRALERQGAAVIAEPLPFGQHIGGRRGSQRIGRREHAHPALPPPQHALDLRLLEHDLAHQHAVGVIDAAPRQIAVESLPLREHVATKLVLRHGGARGPNRGRRKIGYAFARHAYDCASPIAGCAPVTPHASTGQDMRAVGGAESMAFLMTGCRPPCSMSSLSVMESK